MESTPTNDLDLLIFTDQQLKRLDALIQAYENGITCLTSSMSFFWKKSHEIDNFLDNSWGRKLSTAGMITHCAGGIILYLRRNQNTWTGKLPWETMVAGFAMDFCSTLVNSRKTDKFMKEMEEHEEYRRTELGKILDEIHALALEFERDWKKDDDALALAVVKIMDQHEGLKGGKIISPELLEEVGKISPELLEEVGKISLELQVLLWCFSSPSNPTTCLEAPSRKYLPIPPEYLRPPTEKKLLWMLSNKNLTLLGCFNIYLGLVAKQKLHYWENDNKAKKYAKKRTIDLEKLLAIFKDKLLQLRTVKQLIENLKKEITCICQPVELSVFYVNIQSMNPNQPNKSKIQRLRQRIIELKPDIIAVVETWLKDEATVTDDAIREAFNIDGYHIFRHDRKDAYDEAERVRRGGGILLAYKIASVNIQKKFSVKEDQEASNDSSRFFTLSRYFSCGKCSRTDILHRMGSGFKTYSFVVHYQRPGPFQKTKMYEAEPGKVYQTIAANAKNHLINHMSWKTLERTYLYAGGVIVGDFNWNEERWNDFISPVVEESGWKKIPLPPNEHTTTRGTDPDGVLAVPLEFVMSPMLSVWEMETLHKGLGFNLCFGKDYDNENPCNVCKELANSITLLVGTWSRLLNAAI